MPLNAPSDREFRVLQRGYIRDSIILANFRGGLRALKNPETGNPFTEDEIARATRPKSRWYSEAQGTDDYGQGEQRNAIYLSDQVRLERASGKWLLNFHGRLWNASHLDATGGSGLVTVPGVAGTLVLGSTILGDPSAYTARDADGSVYQVMTTAIVGGGGSVNLTMSAVTTGARTNILVGTNLTWTRKDPNMAAIAVVYQNFAGGTDRETDAELASRIAGIIQHKPGAGNNAHVRAWTREASNAIEEGFIYPCAFHAGSFLVAITQKRAGVVGPNARVASATTLGAAIGQLTPPASPVLPPRPYGLVTVSNPESTDLVLRLSMPRAAASGWTDVRPFPKFHATTPKVTARTDDTHFDITCAGDSTLPGQLGGATMSSPNTPNLILWNAATTAFAKLAISSIQDLGGSVFRLILSSPPPFTVALNQIVSPDTPRRDIIATAVQDYFDGLGPGDLFDPTLDVRGARCVRFPEVTEEFPYRASAVVAARVMEALGASASDGLMQSLSKSVPSYPTNLSLGPNMLVPGTVGIYEI